MSRTSRISALVLAALLALVALSLAVAATKPAAKKPAIHVVTVSEEDSNVRLRVGEFLRVRLQATPGTGYSWQITGLDPKMLKPVGEPAMEQTGDKKLVGAPARQIFRFRALAAGMTDLTLQYVRPWEKGKAPAKVYKLKITVLKAKPHKK